MQNRHCDEDALGLSQADLARVAAEEALVGRKTHLGERFKNLFFPGAGVAGPVGLPGFGELRPDG